MENQNNIIGNITEDLIKKIVTYLEVNGLIEDFYKKVYFVIEKSEPTYKIRYYKDKDGKLLGLYDIKQNTLSFDKLERLTVYAYDEIKTLFFDKYVINNVITRHQEYSKSYTRTATTVFPLIPQNNPEDFDLIHFIKSNPLMIAYIIVYYNINFNELEKIDTKSYTYKKEIKKN